MPGRKMAFLVLMIREELPRLREGTGTARVP